LEAGGGGGTFALPVVEEGGGGGVFVFVAGGTDKLEVMEGVDTSGGEVIGVVVMVRDWEGESGKVGDRGKEGCLTKERSGGS
jgi:hypothetical protein